MSAYKNIIHETAENLARLPDLAATRDARAQIQREQLALEIARIKQLGLSPEQLIEECAALNVLLDAEQAKFAEYERRQNVLIRPAFTEAARLADSTIAGTEHAKAERARRFEKEKKIWREAAKSILAGRKEKLGLREKLGQRELARLVAAQINPKGKEELEELYGGRIKKLADAGRKWIADLC